MICVEDESVLTDRGILIGNTHSAVPSPLGMDQDELCNLNLLAGRSPRVGGKDVEKDDGGVL